MSSSVLHPLAKKTNSPTSSSESFSFFFSSILLGSLVCSYKNQWLQLRCWSNKNYCSNWLFTEFSITWRWWWWGGRNVWSSCCTLVIRQLGSSLMQETCSRWNSPKHVWLFNMFKFNKVSSSDSSCLFLFWPRSQACSGTSSSQGASTRLLCVC